MINKDLINKLKSLSRHEKLEVIKLMFSTSYETIPQHKITELVGLGQEIWNGVDAQEYIEKERSSWD